MKKKLATTIATTAIASGLLAFSSISSAATASPTFDFTDNGYAVLEGKGVETVNGLTFDARPNSESATLTFNASTTDPNSTKTPCTTLMYACDGDGIGIKLHGDADEVSGNPGDGKREVLKISGFGGIAINEISFLDLFYEKETSNENFFHEKAFFRFFDSQNNAIGNDIAVASDPTGDNGFAYWTGLVRGVEEIRFFVNCNKVGSIKCSDNDFSVAAVNAVPVPAAVWLFGSGLIGLVGIARRRKTA